MKQTICLLSVLLLSAHLAISQQQTCQALLFNSGGDLGAYQAGVFQGLVNTLAAQDRSYDIITGVGVGAVNAAFIGQFAKGNEILAASELTAIWATLTQSDVYNTWPGGIIQGILFEPAIYNSAPLQNLLQKYITQPQQRGVNAGAVNVNSEEYESFQLDSLSVSDVINVLMASTAKPIIFPYVAYNNNTYFSGEVIQSFDLEAAIERCLEITNNNASAVTVDLVFTANSTLNQWSVNPDDKVLDVFTRYNKIADVDNALRQYTEALTLYPNVNWRYKIHPSIPLPDSNFPFLFSHSDILAMIAQGYSDAVSAVNSQYANDEKFERMAYEKQLRKLGLPVSDKNIQWYKDALKSREDKLKEIVSQQK